MITPDNWIVLHLQIDGYYKILCGWSGGYLDGDRWAMNSGISKIEEDEDAYYVHGISGSIYKCYKDQETLRKNCADIYHKIINERSDIKRVEMNSIKDIFLHD